MKQAKLMTVVAVSVMMTACSHHNNSTPNAGYQSAEATPQTEVAASTYGVGSTSGYQNTGSYTSSSQSTRSGSTAANSLKAPSNQAYHFAFDSNQISASDIPGMTQQANYLATHPNVKVRLEGNTDNRGSREYNVALGWRRDQSVEHFLTQRGVSPKQIQMVSYGKEHPVALGNNPKDWALNRRVNLIYEG